MIYVVYLVMQNLLVFHLFNFISQLSNPVASCNPETANEETQTLSQQSPIFACSVIIAALLAFFSFFFLEKHTYSVLSSITVTPFHRVIRLSCFINTSRREFFVIRSSSFTVEQTFGRMWDFSSRIHLTIKTEFLRSSDYPIWLSS